MRIVIVSVGAPRHPALAAAIRDYESRVARYFALDVVVTRSGGPGSPRSVRSREAGEVLRRLPQGLQCIVLDRAGHRLSSAELAEILEEMVVYGLPGVSFVVGGAFGVDPSVLARADRRLSLSDLTLPHELARLVLAEQLYRAGTILRGEPYHKGTDA